MCCEKENQGKRCVCCPYRSSLLMTSQILSIFAFCISWVWWVTLLIGLPTMIVLQVVWCCKMSKAGIIAAGVMSTLATLLSIVAGVWAITQWKRKSDCWAFIFESYTYYDGYDESYDNCNEIAWGIVAFSQALLWGLSACFIWYLVCSGKVDEMVRPETEPTQDCDAAIEMGTVPQNDDANNQQSNRGPNRGNSKVHQVIMRITPQYTKV